MSPDASRLTSRGGVSYFLCPAVANHDVPIVPPELSPVAEDGQILGHLNGKTHSV